jgi:hypothetical protein
MSISVNTYQKMLIGEYDFNFIQWLLRIFFTVFVLTFLFE